MRNPFRHLFARGPEAAQAAALQRWAADHGYAFRKVRDADGCVVEGQLGTQGWRLEWGQSQRSYISGCELRLMAELGLPHNLMALVLNRVLMAAMEKEVYEQYVNDVQTRIDTDTPAEMRWLVMYGKLSNADLGTLKDRFGVVGSLQPWLLQWLSPALREALAGTIEHVRSDQPVVLTISRGRLTLRTAMPQADAGKLALWFSVFEQAVRSATSVSAELQQAAAASVTPQTAAFGPSEFPRTAAPGRDV